MLKASPFIYSMNLFRLTIGGGVAFWVANFVISRTAIAAEYRAALSISYIPMLIEALIGGLIIGCLVSYLLLRYFRRIPSKNPVGKSVILSGIVLIIVTIFLGGPATALTPSDPWRYLFIGVLFNALRILTLGVVIGYLYKRLYESAELESGAHA